MKRLIFLFIVTIFFFSACNEPDSDNDITPLDSESTITDTIHNALNDTINNAITDTINNVITDTINNSTPIDSINDNTPDDKLYFLGSDQSDYNIRLFSEIKNAAGELIENSIWKFSQDKSPTDAKRVDRGNDISVIVATHGKVYHVPYNYEGKYVYANTPSSCHSVEIIPDGNLISANSTHNLLRLHFNKKDEGDKIKLTDQFDINFRDAHAVVYDKERDVIWALGSTIGMFKYSCCPKPTLSLIKSFPLPFGQGGGHDMYPDGKGNLIITTNQAVDIIDIPNISNPVLVHKEYGIKSAVSNINNEDIFITSPTNISGFANWQTHTIINLNTGEKFKRKNAKFYKVRLWQKNDFSYE